MFLSNRFQTFCQSTSCHGFPELAKSSNRISKFLWLLLIISMSVVLLQSTVNTVSMFFDEEKRWSTSISEKVSNNLEHPTITICNYNRYRQSIVQKLGMSQEVLRYLMENNMATHTISPRMGIPEDRMAWIKWRKEKNITTLQLINMSSHQCEDTIKSVSLSVEPVGPQLILEEPCQAKMQNHSMLIDRIIALDLMTTCSQIRVNLSMSTMGQSRGTMLLLDVEPDEYLDMANNNAQHLGLVMQLTYGERIEYGNWVNLGPGYHAWISMKQEHHRAGQAFDSYFKSPCLKQPEMRFMPDVYYTKELCNFDCELIPMVKLCNCYFFNVSGYDLCELDEVQPCIERSFAEMTKPSIQAELSDCLKTCGDPCELKSITSSTTYSAFPPPTQMAALRDSQPNLFEGLSLEEVRRRYVLVDIFYKSGSVTIIEWKLQNSMSLLFSNLGGQMGLFLGMSIITLVHCFVHFCLEPIRDVWVKNRQTERDVNPARNDSHQSKEGQH